MTTRVTMTQYGSRRGARTGAVLWRVVSDAHEHDVVPDGVMDLLWWQDRLVVAGADTRTVVARTRPGVVTWGLRFPPGVAHALLGVPADELTDRRVELSELVRLPTALVDADGDDVPAALERVLVALWVRADPDRGALRTAAVLDRSARAGRSVPETARLVGLSERSLRRLSGRLFGYGPTTLRQIHRFQRALRLARGTSSLGDAAATAGYADQAHFTREARRLTGRTPSQLANVA